jgi:hypothetical protein
VLGVGEGDLGTLPLFLSQENRSGSGEREQQVHSRLLKKNNFIFQAAGNEFGSMGRGEGGREGGGGVGAAGEGGLWINPLAR